MMCAEIARPAASETFQSSDHLSLALENVNSFVSRKPQNLIQIRVILIKNF